MKTLNQFRQQLRRILSAQRFLFDSCTGKMKGPFRLVSGSYLVGLVAATLLLMGSSAQAADYTWNTTNATWNTTATNWTGSGGGTNPWDITNGATNNATFTVSGANTVTVSGIVYANQITKTDSAGITTLSSGTITLAGSAPSITNNGTSGLTISSKISGSNGVVVTLGSGASTTGSVTFSGANDYTGTTTINGANNGLTISNNAGLGTSAVLVNANGILKVSTSSLSNNITLNGGASNGAIQASANSTLSGLITLASNVTIGNRATSNSTLTLSGGINTTGGANQTLTLNILASSTAINNAITINSTSVNLGTGGILDIGAGIQSTGTGTVNLNVGNNTWGTIIVRAVSTAGVSSNSTLNLGAANALGGSGAVLQLGNSNIALEGITVNLNGNNQTIGGLRSFGSTGSASANGTRTVTSAAAATLTIDNSSATNYLYDGAISGAISVTKNGTATQTLSGNNTYTGATTVNAGTLLLSGNGTLGTSTISLTGGTLDMGGKSLTNTFGSLTGGTLSNGTLTNNGSNYDLQSGIVSAVLAGTNGVNKTTSSTVTLAGANTYTGATTITGGTLSIAAISNGGVAGALGNSTNAAANLVLGGGTLEYTGSANGSTDRNFTLTAATTSGISVSNSTVSLTISGAAAATTGALTKEGAGMLILSGNNTYTGTTTINAGTLQFNSSGQLGGGNYSQNITNNGTLLYSGSNNQTLSGVISGTGALTQNNSSTLTLSGSNTYTGNTTVSAGILNIQHANALGGSANGTIVANGAVLQLQGGITIASEILTLNGSGVSNGGALINSSGNNEWAGNIAIGSATTRIQGTSGNLAISGNISNNAGAQLVFQGSNITVSGIISGNGTLTGGSGLTGLLTLNGNNTYTGASSLTAGTISINSLKDEGVASSLGANGTIQMGASSTTILRYTGAGDTSNRIIDLRGTTGGATIDQSGTGTLRLTSDFTATGAGSKTLTLQGSTVGIGEIAGAVINNNATNTTSLTKTGTGTWILSGNNTFTGTTTVSGGILQFAKTASLYNGTTADWTAAKIRVSSGGTLAFNVGGIGEFSAGNVSTLLTNLGGANGGTSTGFASGSNIGFDTTNAGGSFTIADIIANSTGSGGGAIGLTKLGTNTLILTGANTYTGATTVGISGGANAGTLQLSGAGKISNNATTIFGGTLDLNGTNQSITTLALGGGASGSTAAVTTGSGTLTLGGNVDYSATNNASGASISGNLNLGGATRTFTIGDSSAATSDLTIGAAISNGNLTKSGAGTLTLSGVNNYTGTTSTSAGTLSLIGSLTGGGAISTSGTGIVSQSAAGVISGASAFTQGSSGTSILSGNNTFTGGVTINAGTLQLGNAGALNNTVGSENAITFGASSTGVLSLNGNNIVINSLTSNATPGTPVVQNANTAAAILTVGNTANATSSYAGVLQDGTGGGSLSLTKAGTGALTLSGNNTYTGGTTITSGSISLGADGAMGNGNLTFSPTANAFLNLNGKNQTVTGLTVQAGALAIIQNNLNNTTGTITFDIASGISSSTSNFSVRDQGTNGKVAVVKTGAGTLDFSTYDTSRMTYTAGLTVNGGTLSYNATAVLGNSTAGSAITLGGGTLNYTGSSSVTIANNATLTAGTSSALNNAAGTVTVSGTIGGSGNLSKSGAGTLTLSSANTYQGATTINAGTINLTGSNTASATTVNSGGTLIGTGSAGAVTVNSGAFIGAGNSAAIPGSLTLGSLTLNGGSTYTWDFGNISGTAGTNWDLLNVTGSLTINATNTTGNKFTVAITGTPTGWAPSTSQTWNIMNYGSLANPFDATVFDYTTSLVGAGTWSFTNNATSKFIGLTYTVSSTSTWNGASGNWNSGFSTTPVNGNALVFSGAGGTATNDIVSGNLTSLTTITINSTAGSYTLAANSGSSGFDAATPLTITGVTNNSANATTVNLALAVNSSALAINAAAGNITMGGPISNNNAINFSGANSTTVSGAISGTGAINKDGNGTLTFTGSNSYNGTTTINAGVLNIQHNNALGSTAGGTSVASGAALQLQNNITVTGEALNLTGGGISTNGALRSISGNNTWAGDITIGSAQTRIHADAGNLTISGNISNNAGQALVFQGTSSASIAVTGIISGNGSLTTASTAPLGLLTLSNANTYSGATLIVAGTVAINSIKDVGAGASSLGAVTNTANGTIQIGTSATSAALRYTGSGDTSNRTINLGGSTGGATIDQSGTGTLRLTSDFTATGAGSKTLTLQGSTVGIGEIAGAVINNNATNTTSLTKTGTGTWILSGANTYTGATMINAGTLQIGNGSSSGSISASSAITNNATLVFNRLGTVTQGTDFANSITGTGNLTQAGSGTLFLGGTNSYAGLTTISAGSLSISSVSALGSTSGVSLANATALIYTGGTASLDRAISVTSGTGTIRNTGGALTLTGGLSKNGTTLTFDSGTFHVNSAIIGPAANSDLIVDGATVTLNAANTYNGPTFIIDGGTLTANVTGALPTSTRTAISIDATGTGSSTLALGANQSIASLAGNTTSTVALGSSTLTINSTSGSTTYAGRITGGASSALVKEGASTQVLSGNNSAFTGSTTVNSGTLQASAAGALGGTSNIDINGGSFLVAAANAVNDNANINIKGGTLAVSGDFNETVGALTLSANSIIDLNGFSGILRFSGLSWAGTAPNATLAIWNWSGTPQHGAPVNDYTNPSHVVFTSDANLTPENLAKISFYSGNGIGFVGNAFEQSFTQSGFATGTEIIAVPEPETYLIGVLLIFGFTIYQLRRSKIWAIVPHGPNFSSEAPEPLPETIPPKNRPTHTPRADTPN